MVGRSIQIHGKEGQNKDTKWMEWLKILLQKVLGSNANDYRSMQELYRGWIDDLNKQLVEQKKIIEEHRKTPSKNGRDLDAWLAREEVLNLEMIKLIRDKRDLHEEAIFLKEEIKRLNRLLNK
jgi:hypothetical protein